MQLVINIFNNSLLFFKCKSDKAKGLIIYVFACLILAIIASISRYLGSNLHVANIIFYRGIVLFFILYFGLKKYNPEAIKTNNFNYLTFCGLMAFVGLALWFHVLQIVPMGEATALMFISPVFTMILAIIFLKEKMMLHRFAAVLISISGALIICNPDFSTFNNKYIWVLIAALLGAIYANFIRNITFKEHPQTISLYIAFFKMFFAFPFAIIYFQLPTLEEAFWLIILGIISAPGQVLNMTAISKVELNVLQPFDFTMFIFSTIFGFIIFGDNIYFTTIIGAAIILLGSILIIKKESFNE